MNRTRLPVTPQECQFTANGNEFLVFHSEVGDNERILIFPSLKDIQFLVNSKRWYEKGTVEIYPDIFLSLYVAPSNQKKNISTSSCTLAQQTG